MPVHTADATPDVSGTESKVHVMRPAATHHSLLLQTTQVPTMVRTHLLVLKHGRVRGIIFRQFSQTGSLRYKHTHASDGRIANAATEFSAPEFSDRHTRTLIVCSCICVHAQVVCRVRLELQPLHLVDHPPALVLGRPPKVLQPHGIHLRVL